MESVCQNAKDYRVKQISKHGLSKFVHVGKDLYACQTAITDFGNILETIAGPQELERSKMLLSRITVVEDDPSERADMLEESHRIKHRTKASFC